MTTISGNTNLIHIMNKLVHLLEPGVSILVLEICPHSPHDMIRPSYVSLENSRKRATVIHLNRLQLFPSKYPSV